MPAAAVLHTSQQLHVSDLIRIRVVNEVMATSENPGPNASEQSMGTKALPQQQARALKKSPANTTIK